MKNINEYINKPIEYLNTVMFFFHNLDKITIFDIGACEGGDSIKYSNLFPNSSIFSFEPLPKNFKKLKYNIRKYKKTNIFPFKLALSDSNGRSMLNISSGTPDFIKKTKQWNYGNKSSSLLSPSMVKSYYPWLKFKEKVVVTTETLSRLCSKLNIKHIDIAHIDVQGAELLVLNGAGKYLKKIKFIWLEVEAVELYESQPLASDIDIFLKKNGFLLIRNTLKDVSGDRLYVNWKYLPYMLINKLLFVVRHVLQKGMRSVRAKLKKESVSKKSFSQCGEDLIMAHLFSMLKIESPSYIDVGSNHPYKLNNTILFYLNGSRGVNIEPNPILYKKLCRFRKNDTNLNIGISGNCSLKKFYVFSPNTLSTFSKIDAMRYAETHNKKNMKTLMVATLKIENIVNNYCNGVFPDLLCLDTEGFDEKIIDTIDFDSKNIPKVICVESIYFKENGFGRKNRRLIKKITNNGYDVYADTNINTIFIRSNLAK